MTRPGAFRHWSDLLEPLVWILGAWAVGVAIAWVIA
jgi:hypothetical protein